MMRNGACRKLRKLRDPVRMDMEENRGFGNG